MKRLSFIMLLLLTVLMANALDIRQQNINRIKKSKAFLYSDVTMKAQENAVSQAYEQIQVEIINWASERSQKKITNIPVTELNKIVDTIMVRRAEMYRVVAFVRKDKVAATFKEWKITLVKELDTDPRQEPEETMELSDTIAQENYSEKIDSVASMHKRDSLKTEEKKDSLVSDKVISLLKNNYLGKKGGVIEQINKAKNFFELKQIMEPLKQKGDILDYGKYATANNLENCYLIVYDPAGNIKALLDKGEKVRKNLKTGKEDSIKNYRGCGAIWFTIKE